MTSYQLFSDGPTYQSNDMKIVTFGSVIKLHEMDLRVDLDSNFQLFELNDYRKYKNWHTIEQGLNLRSYSISY